MTKELEALWNINRYLTKYFNRALHRPENTLVKWVEIETIEKSLKALEIIKEKKCDIYLLMECERLEHYNENDYLCSDQVLTQEEFDLLKEVLQ